MLKSLFSTTAYFADGRMVENTWLATSLPEAIAHMKTVHPLAQKVLGEYVMEAADYLGIGNSLAS